MSKINCPFCKQIHDSSTLSTRIRAKENIILRRRECFCCKQRFNTCESIEDEKKEDEEKENDKSEKKEKNVFTKIKVKRFTLNPETQQYSYNPPLNPANLRGDKYKEVLEECSEQLVKYFKLERQKAGKTSRKEIVCISQLIGLPLKATVEFLEYLDKVPPETWKRKFANKSAKTWIEMYTEEF